MKIAFVLPYLAERFGGPVCAAKSVGREMTALGHEVTHWAPVAEEDRAEVSKIESARAFDLDWPRGWFRSKSLARALADEIASFDILQVSGFWTYPALAGCRIAAAANTPYVFRPAGCFEPWRLHNTPLKWLKKRAYLAFARRAILDRTACLHAVTAQEAQHFRLIGYPGPITVIPNAVDTELFHPGDGAEAEGRWPEMKGRPVVLFLSRLSPEKGLDTLIPAWAGLLTEKRHGDALLVIAGPGSPDDTAAFDHMIQAHGLGSKTLVTGMVSGSLKQSLYRRADIFALPSYSENFGLVVTEAMASGLPVITTTGTPWKEIQERDAGRWISPEKEPLREALDELLGLTPDQRHAMGLRGRQLVAERYSWKSVAARMLAVYGHVLRGEEIPFNPEAIA